MERSRLLVTDAAELPLRQATGSLIMTLGRIKTMDYLNIASQIASILGLAASVWAIWRLRNLRRLMGVQSLSKGIFTLFDEILLFPQDKRSLTQTNTTKVEQLIIYLEMFYVSKMFWKHRNPKKIIKKLKEELKNAKLTDNIRRDVSLLRDQLFSVENF